MANFIYIEPLKTQLQVKNEKMEPLKTVEKQTVGNNYNLFKIMNLQFEDHTAKEHRSRSETSTSVKCVFKRDLKDDLEFSTGTEQMFISKSF